MPLVTLRDESKLRGDFYVPRFEIKIAGVSLPRDVLRDVEQITYNDNVKELDSFELTVNNWDADAQDFKYVGSETADSLSKNPLHLLFNPCRHNVDVLMGYGDNLSLMVTGNFTTLEPNFPASSAPKLTVRGLNILHKLRRKQFSYAWNEEKSSNIAKSFETLPDPSDRKNKRFPLPVEIDPNSIEKEEKITYLAQNNQYDIDFLLGLARRVGYVVFVKEEEQKNQRVVKPRRLYFGPSDAKRPDTPKTFELKWGISLMDFKPTLTTANQIKTVTVHGWNRSTKQPITGRASFDDPKLKLNSDLYKQLETCDPREERVVDEPVFTQKEADERARAILLERGKDLVKASGTCVGLPELRAGRRVQIAGLGVRFSGEYFITDTTHTIGEDGYITKFNARREQQGK